jgi:hypothetical protein
VTAGRERPGTLSIESDELPLRAEKVVRNAFGGKIAKERDRSTAASIEMPDLSGMVSNHRSQDTMNDPFNTDDVMNYDFTEGKKKKFSLMSELYDEQPFPKPKMTPQFGSALKDMGSKIGIERGSSVIAESQDIFNNSGSSDE